MLHGPALPVAGARLGNAVVPQAYTLELELDPRQQTYRGQVVIELRLHEPVDVLWLHARDLEIEDAVLSRPGPDAQASMPRPLVLAAAPDAGQIGLRLQRPVPPGPATLEIAFRGRYDDRVGVFRQTVGQDAYVFTDFEPIDARRGFPCFDEPRFKTPWTLSLITPAHMHGLSNMPAIAAEPLPGGKQRVRFAPTRPLPSYLVAFAVGPFDIMEGATDPVPIRVVAPRGMGGRARTALELIPPLLRIIQSYMATPVPFPKLDFVSVPSFDGAMENPGLITVGSHILLLDPDDPPIPQTRFLALVTAHELAHLWFGDLVTPMDWRDLWLNEGFATWLADKALMAWRPERMPHVDQVKEKLEAMLLDQAPGARAVRQPVHTSAEIRAAFDGITYKKGGALVAMFEAWLSEAGFRRAMHAYVAAHAEGSATADTLMTTLEQTTGQPVRAAFTSFLEQPGVPLVRAELACEAAGTSPGEAAGTSPGGPLPGGVAVVRLTQEPFGPPPPDAHGAAPEVAGTHGGEVAGTHGGTGPLWHIPVCLRYPDGKTSRRTCVLLDQRSARVPLAAASCPAWVHPNAGASGYYRYHVPPAQLLALARAPLSVREATELVHGMHALARQGMLGVPDILPALDHLAQRRERHVTVAIIDLFEDIARHLSTADEQRRFQAQVRQLYRARARALGFAHQPGDSEEQVLLRPTLVAFVGHHGRDPTLLATARRLTEQWLRTNSGIAPGMIRTTLTLAAASGDAALFDRMEQALHQALAGETGARDEMRVAALLAGLGAFSTDALVDRALRLAVAGPLTIEQRYTLLAHVLDFSAGQPAGQRPGQRPGQPATLSMVLAFLERHGATLAAQPEGRLLLLAPLLDAPLCSKGDLARARALATLIGTTSLHAQALARAERTAEACARFRAGSPRP